MAEGLWLCTRSDQKAPNRKTVNGINAVLINADDAQTEAQTIAEAVARLQEDGHDVRDDYFTDAVLVSDLVTGPLPDDGDMYIMGDLAPTLSEA